MANQLSNKIKYLLLTKTVSFSADVFKVILMQQDFIFSEDAHETYSLVSADELETGSGYIAGGQTLSGVAVTENDTTNSAYVTWDNLSWTFNTTAVTTRGAIIYDDTVASPSKPVVGYIDFGDNVVMNPYGTLTITNINFNLE